MRGQRASAEGGGGGLVAIIEVVLILHVVPVMWIARGRGVMGIVAERVAALHSSQDVGKRGRDRRAATSTVAAEGHHVMLLLLLLLLVRHEVGCVVRRERELLVLLLWELLQLLLLLVVVQLVGRGEVGSHLGDSVIHSSSFNLEWRKEKNSR